MTYRWWIVYIHGMVTTISLQTVIKTVGINIYQENKSPIPSTCSALYLYLSYVFCLAYGNCVFSPNITIDKLSMQGHIKTDIPSTLL